MEQFLKQLHTIPEVAELVRRVEEGGCPVAVTGLQPVHRSCVGAAVALAAERPAVFVCGDEREAQQLRGDLQTLLGAEPVVLLGREWQLAARRHCLPGLGAQPSGGAVCPFPGRGAGHGGHGGRIVRPDAAAQAAPFPGADAGGGSRADLNELADRLVSAGYTRCQQVEGVGQFALRGGILDVFSPLDDQRCGASF